MRLSVRHNAGKSGLVVSHESGVGGNGTLVPDDKPIYGRVIHAPCGAPRTMKIAEARTCSGVQG